MKSWIQRYACGKMLDPYKETYEFLQIRNNGQNERFSDMKPVFPIRIHQINMFLGLPDPDPLVRGMDPRIQIHTKMSWIRNTDWICSDW